MKKIILILVLIIFITGCSESSRIGADEQLAGITPDSALYGLDVFIDNARAAMTIGSLDRAKVRLEITEERVAEMEEMANKNKTAEASRAGLEVQKQIEKFESSAKRIKHEDVPELNESIQTNAETLELFKQILMNYDESEYADAIAEALRILESSENVIANIPEDFDPRAAFILSSGSSATFESMTAQCIEAGNPPEECAQVEDFCKEVGATTADKCVKMLSSGFFTATVRAFGPGERPPDPHNCSGHHTFFKKKYCCEDSDGSYWDGDTLKSDFYTKGIVDYRVIKLVDETALNDEILEHETHTDSCDGNTLTEWMCAKRDRTTSEEFECLLGCEDGACVKEEEEYELPEGAIPITDTTNRTYESYLCDDSDAHLTDTFPNYYYVKGTVDYTIMETVEFIATHEQYHSATKHETYTDSCDGKILTEWRCGSRSQILADQFLCPDSCQDGACIEEATEQEVPEEILELEEEVIDTLESLNEDLE